ncbi:MAG: hypothetical protein RLZZ574_2377 [Cyanobacteriota bacterium]|jgi:hypothetical protein
MNLTIMFTPANYEATMYCAHSREMLKEIMQEAVNEYLFLNSKVYIIANNDLSIVLRIPISTKSWGEILKVSVEKESFCIVSECAVFFQTVDWGKNHNNVKAMSTCLQNAISLIMM